MSRASSERSHEAFTLIELLVVIAIIAILAVVVVLTLNPGQLFLQARDSNRLSDLATIQSALGYYITDTAVNGGGSLGAASTTYISIPDPTATSTAGDQCQGLGLPALASGFTYHCAASSTFRSVDGTGWIPVNFKNLSQGSVLGQLPVDVVNQTSTGLFYTYQTNGSQFEVTAIPESQKQKTALGQNPMIPLYPDVMAQGNNLSISALWNQSGLVGYWPMDEGTGTTALDMSGNGNGGTLSSPAPTWVSGKVGGGALNFDGSTNKVSISANNFPLGGNPRSVFAWVYLPSVSSGAYIVQSYGAYSGSNYSALWIYVGSVYFGDNAEGYVGTLSVTPNAWHSVGYMYNGGTNVTTCLDGQCVTGTLASPLNTVLPGSDPADIGVGDNYAHNFPGLIDDVRIYNRALSAAEVQALYNAER